MSLSLEKIVNPAAHDVHGQEFPVAYQLINKGSELTNSDVAEFLKETGKDGWFNEQVKLHGALLLRGLGATDPVDISTLIKAIGYSSGDEPFIQAGTTAKRTKLTDVITTANEGSPELYIDQHNEFSRFIQYPTKLFFVCQKFTGKGGETPIVHGSEIFDHLHKSDPANTETLGKDGLLFNQTWPFKTPNNTSWQDFFCFGRYIEPSDDLKTRKFKAEELVEKYVSSDYKWDEKNNLVVNEHTEPIKQYQRPDGKILPVFFNSLPTYYADWKGTYHDQYRKTSALSYDNGKLIPVEYLEKVLKNSRELAYLHSWEQGDIVIVDNYQVSHGRVPWSDGDRVVLVSMWDTPNKPEYAAWKGKDQKNKK